MIEHIARDEAQRRDPVLDEPTIPRPISLGPRAVDAAVNFHDQARLVAVEIRHVHAQCPLAIEPEADRPTPETGPQPNLRLGEPWSQCARERASRPRRAKPLPRRIPRIRRIAGHAKRYPPTRAAAHRPWGAPAFDSIPVEIARSVFAGTPTGVQPFASTPPAAYALYSAWMSVMREA